MAFFAAAGTELVSADFGIQVNRICGNPNRELMSHGPLAIKRTESRLRQLPG